MERPLGGGRRGEERRRRGAGAGANTAERARLAAACADALRWMTTAGAAESGTAESGTTLLDAVVSTPRVVDALAGAMRAADAPSDAPDRVLSILSFGSYHGYNAGNAAGGPGGGAAAHQHHARRVSWESLSNHGVGGGSPPWSSAGAAPPPASRPAVVAAASALGTLATLAKKRPVIARALAARTSTSAALSGFLDERAYARMRAALASSSGGSAGGPSDLTVDPTCDARDVLAREDVGEFYDGLLLFGGGGGTRWTNADAADPLLGHVSPALSPLGAPRSNKRVTYEEETFYGDDDDDGVGSAGPASASVVDDERVELVDNAASTSVETPTEAGTTFIDDTYSERCCPNAVRVVACDVFAAAATETHARVTSDPRSLRGLVRLTRGGPRVCVSERTAAARALWSVCCASADVGAGASAVERTEGSVHALAALLTSSSRCVLSHTGSITTPFARWTPILKDFCRRISPPRVPRCQSPPSAPFNSL